MNSRGGYRLRAARIEDARALARIMMDEVSWGRLRDLGLTFNTYLHRLWIRSKYGVVVVVEHDGEICAYGAGLTDTRKFHRGMVLQRGPVLALLLLPRLLRWKNLCTILRAYTYFPRAPAGDPRAELVSLNCRREHRRAGLGRLVYDGLMEGLKAKGVDRVKLGHVDTSKETANAFWQGMGAEYLRTEAFYAHNRVNVYVYRIP